MAQGNRFWDVLGIEPTNDKTVIKRAFSKLAHKTNPEDDPEGYSKLHEAYKAALSYAAGEHIDSVDPTAGTSQKESDYDFTSLNDQNKTFDMEVSDLLVGISKFKAQNHIDSYAGLFSRPEKELHDIAIQLFDLYSVLAIKTDDLSIWDTFFNEPVINTLMSNTELRYHMINGFPEGNLNRTAINGFVNAYEQSVSDKIHTQEQEKERTEKLKKATDIWIYLAVIFSVIGVILLFCGSLIEINNGFLFSFCCSASALGLSSFARHFIWLRKYEEEKSEASKFLPISFLLLATVFLVAALLVTGFNTDPLNLTALIVGVISSIATILMHTVFRIR